MSGVPEEIIGLAWGTLHPITVSLLHVGRFFVEAIKPLSILIKTFKTSYQLRSYAWSAKL